MFRLRPVVSVHISWIFHRNCLATVAVYWHANYGTDKMVGLDFTLFMLIFPLFQFEPSVASGSMITICGISAVNTTTGLPSLARFACNLCEYVFSHADEQKSHINLNISLNFINIGRKCWYEFRHCLETGMTIA